MNMEPKVKFKVSFWT